MKKQIFLSTLIILLSVSFSYAQEVLDTARYREAELFILKKDYDIEQRIQEIKSIEGKEVTVFEVSGKQNKIKLSYKGIAEMAGPSSFTDKQKATLITVKVFENGKLKAAYFPLTNSNRTRIYLSEKMK